MQNEFQRRPVNEVPDDLSLLRQYEPVLRLTKGELFMPTAVGPYVAYCSLWAGEQDAEATCVVAGGELSLERLCQEGITHQERALSLRFVREPLGRTEYRRWRREPRERLDATTRFTTTGMFGRLIDAGFRGSLLVRGKVAAGLAAAAEIAYREELEADRFTYYGRVVREGGYICLQYWLFYAMNDWRSTFSGVNDHEADWELITVYLTAAPGHAPQPRWVALSSHEHQGDSLRRRWDDPELRRQGNHPVAFAGAGSHSGAFVPGDYVISVDPQPLRAAIAFARRARRLLAPWRTDAESASGFGIPFIDYARGDGLAIGPEQEAQWQAVLIDDDTSWVRDYIGLWGLDTYDRFGGERAPAGPRYERDGSVRFAWANPLGWAGLLKVPSGDEEADELLTDRVRALERELRDLDDAIDRERSTLRGLLTQARSLEVHDYARRLADARRGEVAQHEDKLNEMVEHRARLAEERRIHLDTLRRPQPAEHPQAHLTARYGPRSEEQAQRRYFLKLWAVVSTPLLLAGVIVILVAPPLAWATTVVLLIAAFLGVEAFAHRRFFSYVGSVLLLVTVIVVTAGFLVLFRQHWRLALSVVIGVAAVALLAGNLRDLRHGWRRGRDDDV